MVTDAIYNLKIDYYGFSYEWREENAFLNLSQAKYALKILWALTAGTSRWEGAPAIHFVSISSKQVDLMFSLEKQGLVWLPLDGVSPSGYGIDIDTTSLPVICAVDPIGPVMFNGSGYYPLDLVAATFILLTRWEEWKTPILDKHLRHEEDATICARQGFRDRPVLDEWAKMLRPWLIKKSPKWKPNMPEFKVWMTHDIDHLFYYKNSNRVLRGLVRGIIHNKSINKGVINTYEGILSLIDQEKDPCFKSIEMLMNLDEELGERATFFFMSAKKSRFDDGYDLGSKESSKLLDAIKSRGHEISWHPGYFSDKDEIFDQELEYFTQISGLSQIGIRNHYLRWDVKKTWRRLEDKGIYFDASVGYSNHLGFRSSTSHPYPAYDLLSDKPLSLVVRPLIVMDRPLFSKPHHMEDNIRQLLQRCKAVNGCFSVLVHNYTCMINCELVFSLKNAIQMVR